MSNKISALVWDQAKCGGTRKLVLLALADAANQEGMCWPSIATVARMAGCSPRRAQEHITALAKDGWVSRIPYPGHSNYYVVHAPDSEMRAESEEIPNEDEIENAPIPTISQGCEISQGSDEDVPQGVRNLAGGGAKSRRGGCEISQGGVRNLAPRTVSNLLLNPKRTDSAHTSKKNDESEGNADAEEDAAPPPPPPPAPLDVVRLWSRTVNHLRGTPISREALANWIAPMRATTADEEDGVLVVRLCAPGTEARRIAEQRFHGAIVGAMSTITGRRVALIIEAQVTAPPQSRLEVEA